MSGEPPPPFPVEYLDVEDLLGLVRRLGVQARDVGLLDAATARPRSSVPGEDAYPTLDLKAAALLESLARDHPLVDGNKRLAWWATTLFLWLNEREPALSDDEAFLLVMDVARGACPLEETARRLRLR
jgi:death-on-curing protein